MNDSIGSILQLQLQLHENWRGGGGGGTGGVQVILSLYVVYSTRPFPSLLSRVDWNLLFCRGQNLKKQKKFSF